MSSGQLTAGIAFVMAVLAILGWIIRWGWRVLRRISHFLDDYNGQPARDGLPERPGLVARLNSLEQLLQHVVDETKPNHGGSMRDSLNRLERDVAAIAAEQAIVRTRLQISEGNGP